MRYFPIWTKIVMTLLAVASTVILAILLVTNIILFLALAMCVSTIFILFTQDYKTKEEKEEEEIPK